MPSCLLADEFFWQKFRANRWNANVRLLGRSTYSTRLIKRALVERQLRERDAAYKCLARAHKRENVRETRASADIMIL